MVLVDSSTWINHLKNCDTPARRMLLDFLHNNAPMLVGDLILLEVLRGCRGETEYKRVHGALSVLPWVALLDPQRAVRAANHYRGLRAKGITIRKPNDVIIATYCIEKNIPLLHDDRDFDPFEQHLGLRTIKG